jgi:hypothetical protein
MSHSLTKKNFIAGVAEGTEDRLTQVSKKLYKRPHIP